MSIALNLRKLRTMKGLTQLQLAEAVGLTRGKIASYECEAVMPPYPTIIKLASFFHVNPDDLSRSTESEIERLYIAREAGALGPKQDGSPAQDKVIKHLEKILENYEKLNEEKDELIKELKAKLQQQ